MEMNRKVKVSLIKVIQLRHEYVDDDGKIKGWNEKFQKPTVAAEHWATARSREWQDRKFSHYSLMTQKDYEDFKNRYEKLYRRSLPVFKAMLASS